MHDLTVGELLAFIEKHKIPLDAKVLTQRVEDHYYENNGWKTVDKVEEDRFSTEGINRYTQAFCCQKYSKDNDLYINLHY